MAQKSVNFYVDPRTCKKWAYGWMEFVIPTRCSEFVKGPVSGSVLIETF
jgi:hypothetical protein